MADRLFHGIHRTTRARDLEGALGHGRLGLRRQYIRRHHYALGTRALNAIDVDAMGTSQLACIRRRVTAARARRGTRAVWHGGNAGLGHGGAGRLGIGLDLGYR